MRRKPGKTVPTFRRPDQNAGVTALIGSSTRVIATVKRVFELADLPWALFVSPVTDRCWVVEEPTRNNQTGLLAPCPLTGQVRGRRTTGLPTGPTPVDQLAREMLSLSKLNWNNTQFDGGEPITVRAARRVGDILKCVAEGGKVQPTFRFFI